MDKSGLAAVWNVLPEARIVGGVVRDQIAGLPVSDVDLASPLPPATVIARLEAAGLRAIPTGIAHGTVTALAGDQSFEITTLRRDIETDGRRAVVAFIDDWQADAARRDFTINAMSMDRAGTIFDYFGGQADLAAGVVRFVGKPAIRIAEDYLRILRFFRFFARYARGEPDAPAIAAIAASRAGLSQLSAERVWQELKKILAAPNPRAALHLMCETGVMAVILPEAQPLDTLDIMIARAAPVDPLLRFAALMPDDPATADRLKLSDAERSRLTTLATAPLLPPDADAATCRRALADWETGALVDRTWLATDADRSGLRARLVAMPRPVFPLMGRDALALGAMPGRALGEALAAARDWWLTRDCLPGKAESLGKLEALLHEKKSKTFL
ncbi:MAG: CCA tRNA nucleotidyltransferase [Acidiphilium sp.]|nr:CCA tRNA nucleotidyltransferase [Acidiphilium sp.]MDD4936523.1 CCA tRNA nucleotidyltransferase [Acidiphilium sp.]